MAKIHPIVSLTVALIITVVSVLSAAIGVIIQQSVVAANRVGIVVSPVITANLAPSQYHIKDQYALRKLVVKNITHVHEDNTTFSLVDNTPEPEVTISESGSVDFGGRLAIHTGSNNIKYIPIDIIMSVINKTVDPKTNTTTMKLGMNSNIILNAPLPP